MLDEIEGEDAAPDLTVIELPLSTMAMIARRFGVRELALFGSVLRPGDFRDDSDIDVLVSFEKDAARGLFEFVQLKLELTDLIGRDVDLVEKEGLKQFIREEVLATRVVVLYGT